MPTAFSRRPAPSALVRTLVLVAALFSGVTHGALRAVESSGRGNGRGRGPRLSPPADTRGLSRIFFPPVPPRLRAPFNLFDGLGLGRPAPAALAVHVNEPYYAPLSTRLDEGDLSPAESARLDTYLASKRAQQAELRRRIEALARADPDTRERLLTAFAAEQTPRLVELEAEADSIRQDLIRHSDNWYTYRTWRLGSTPFPGGETAMRAQVQVMRAAPFYQKGLSPAQRRLLREIAIEMEGYERMPMRGIELAADANPLFFFSPDTARLRLPAVPPAELAALVSTYEEHKARLKQELRTVIYETDDALLGLIRQRRIVASPNGRLPPSPNLNFSPKRSAEPTRA